MNIRLEFERRIREQIEARKPAAQYYLDTQVMADMTPYMPMLTGTFRNGVLQESASLAGSGKVCVTNGISGRYLYYGKVMVDSETGKGPRRILTKDGEIIYRYKKGSKLIPSGRNLVYSNPQAEPEWDKAAIRDHYDEWCEGVRKVFNGQN